MERLCSRLLVMLLICLRLMDRWIRFWLMLVVWCCVLVRWLCEVVVGWVMMDFVLLRLVVMDSMWVLLMMWKVVVCVVLGELVLRLKDSIVLFCLFCCCMVRLCCGCEVSDG